ncbi:MAG: alpha/beta hydrolase [Deltaproteobacteria bacterium]|nr:alpha/beta hydrolase [Deltaproteobacteria bacterium]
MKITSEFLTINDRSIHVRVYNPEQEKTIVCWHGLARNGFDFQTIALLLSKKYRVLCPDTLGRGLSQWAKDPAKEYNYPNYVNIAMGICEHFNVQKLDWIGTSMGGIIGIVLASGPYTNRIQRLVINDIGPEIPDHALQRIIDYVSGIQPEFDTFIEYENYLKELYLVMGERTDEQWFQMTSRSLRRKDNGRLTVHFDPDIIQISDETVPAMDLWELFKQVECKVMLLHGLLSDVLTQDIVKRMESINSKMKVITIHDCGHAPGLHLDHHKDPILKFLS